MSSDRDLALSCLSSGGSGRSVPSFLSSLPPPLISLSQTYQLILDKWTPHTATRWVATVLLMVAFGIRIFVAQVGIIRIEKLGTDVCIIIMCRAGTSSRTLWPSITSTSYWPSLHRKLTQLWRKWTRTTVSPFLYISGVSDQNTDFHKTIK